MASNHGEPQYSRDEFVAALTSYYEFLTEIFLPMSVLQHPPPSGWDHIASDYKDEAVVDLMRHIPYIRYDYVDKGKPYMIYERCMAADYAGEIGRMESTRYDKRALFEPGPEIEQLSDIPSYVYCLGTIAGGSWYGNYIFVDTRRGTVTVCDLNNGAKPTELSEEPENEGDCWREHETYPAVKFFEKLKEEWRQFKLIACSRKTVVKWGNGDEKLELIKKIYEEEGLFTSAYDLERCMRRVEAVDF
ncbi:uncharacterized protein CTRU02_215711 [Colletotrichum truncatum]|uniref:Uncharacterized protein n=1 Tax=Colletotrichum truncatum TaxID=5467 RepID=A0ACC3YC07_COLTU|nr:uncharacterized protein CTRU02_14918 [Colletotrichum truncatum]KAF6781620.1 hypothetical protein CTRU02_14918 [Colletotrichum truncatum]